jgi:hypothetical protein
MLLVFLLLLFAEPFWQAKPPMDWSEDELLRLLTNSPWAELVTGPGQNVPAPAVQVYLATAAPMEQAERERDRRYRVKQPNPSPEATALAEEYQAWLKENRTTQIVVAVRMTGNAAFFDQKEVQRMEDESVMQVGRKKFKMTGHFPPSAADPYVRLAFPRQVQPGDKSVIFDLYLPGVPIPYREAEFSVKQMTLNGKLEL